MDGVAAVAPVGLAFRPAGLDDAAQISDLTTAFRPDEPEDQLVERHLMAEQDGHFERANWIVEIGRRPVGYVVTIHVGWARSGHRTGWVLPALMPDVASLETWSLTIAQGEAWLRSVGADRAQSNARADETGFLAAWAANGHVEDRFAQSWELDLVARRDHLLAMAETSRSRDV